jgi:hypothetical protein
VLVQYEFNRKPKLHHVDQTKRKAKLVTIWVTTWASQPFGDKKALPGRAPNAHKRTRATKRNDLKKTSVTKRGNTNKTSTTKCGNTNKTSTTKRDDTNKTSTTKCGCAQKTSMKQHKLEDDCQFDDSSSHQHKGTVVNSKRHGSNRGILPPSKQSTSGPAKKKTKTQYVLERRTQPH